MKTLQQLLEEKNQRPIAASPEDTVLSALHTLAKYDVGALLVLENKKLVGIFSERDYARKVALRGHTSKDMLVRDIMSPKVTTVLLSNSIEDCMSLMTERHFRHLPVLDKEGDVLGMISIGDLVKETIQSKNFVIAQLEGYIRQ